VHQNIHEARIFHITEDPAISVAGYQAAGSGRRQREPHRFN
jgi:hypothetical protein